MTTPPTSFRLRPESASAFAAEYDTLFLALTIVSVLLTLAVFALVVTFGLRYRRRHEDEVPRHVPASRWIETAAAAGLLVLFMGMFAWGAVLYIDERRPAASAIEVDVVAKQWMWKVQHPGGQREINALHVPLGRPVRLIMTSQDVIHSFGLPAFRIKQDVLPGRYTTQWFTATRVGEYDLFCNEYCGTDHSRMRGRVVVMSEPDYQAWLAGVPADDLPAVAGARLFVTYGCNTCHGQSAPTLAGLYGRSVRLDDGSTTVADETYIRESILSPSSQVVSGYPRAMPSYRGQLSEEQIAALVAYLKTLGAARPDSSASSDSSAPTSRPINGIAATAVPNVPPAREPPSVTREPIRDGGRR